MDPVQQFLRQKHVYTFGVAALFLAVLAVYLPSLAHPFMSDDYHVLAALASQPKDLVFFFTGNGKYLIPVTKLFWVVQYALFQTNAWGFHLASLLLHLANTALVTLFFTRLFRSKWQGLLTGVFFGLSASHWRTTMWISAQVKLLAALFLLLALLSFLSFLRTGQWRFLWGTALAQVAMPFASALGMELPFILLTLYLFQRQVDPKRVKVASRQAWSALALIAGLCIVYVVLQHTLYAHANTFLLSDQGIFSAIQNIPRAARWLMRGIFEGLLRSSTGVFVGAVPSIFSLHGAAVPLGVIMLPLVMFPVLVFVPKRRWDRPFILLLLLLTAWVVLLYAPPILPDMAQRFTEQWFITRPRYFYLPMIPMAAIIAVLLTTVRTTRRHPLRRWSTLAALVIFGGFVVLSNLQRIRFHEQFAAEQTQQFAVVRDALVADLRGLLRQTWGTRVLTIRDSVLGQVTGMDYAAHNVLPSHLARAYLPPAERASFRFLPEGVPADFGITPQGRLWPPVAQQ